MRKYKKGFTLAEILVTLGVIGVIASMTVPTLVQDIQDAQYKAVWKKIFADLNQATKMILLDNSGSLKGIFTSGETLRNVYTQKLNYVKFCDLGNSEGCWHTNGTYKYLNGSIITSWGNGPGLILNTGAFLKFTGASANCSNTTRGVPICGEIFVDINGSRGPNTVGRDIFFVYMQENSTKPFGSIGDIYYPPTDCIQNSSGHSCSAIYLYQ